MKRHYISAFAALGLMAGASASADEFVCEEWQFLLQSDTPASNALLVGEVNTDQTQEVTFSDLHDVDSENPQVQPAVTFSVDLRNAKQNELGYVINADLPLSQSGPATSYNIEATGPLRQGYVSLHQEGDARFTLFAQRMTCG
jgi:hypothetical protein